MWSPGTRNWKDSWMVAEAGGLLGKEPLPRERERAAQSVPLYEGGALETCKDIKTFNFTQKGSSRGLHRSMRGNTGGMRRKLRRMNCVK